MKSVILSIYYMYYKKFLKKNLVVKIFALSGENVIRQLKSPYGLSATEEITKEKEQNSLRPNQGISM